MQRGYKKNIDSAAILSCLSDANGFVVDGVDGVHFECLRAREQGCKCRGFFWSNQLPEIQIPAAKKSLGTTCSFRRSSPESRQPVHEFTSKTEFKRQQSANSDKKK
jgi:hypothetical protein